MSQQQQQQQQSAIDGCFREMRHPSPKKQRRRKKELTKKERKLQYSLPKCEEEGGEEGDKSAGAQDYKICNLRRGHNRKYKSFRFITSTPSAHLESRADHKGTSGHLERLLPGTSRTTSEPFGTSWLQDLARGASPQCRLCVVAGLESLPGLIIALG